MLCIVLLCACGSDKDASQESQTDASQSETTETTQEPESTQTTVVQKYGDLPENYTPEQALADGCLVLQWTGSATENPEVSGMEYWDAFLSACEDGEQKAVLRVLYFQNGIYYYSDLTFSKGYYSLYTLNEFQNYENAIGSYQYIKRIEGVEPNTGNYVCYYILTDLAELTSEDVLSAAQICDIETERGVPYEPIPFTQYLFLDNE